MKKLLFACFAMAAFACCKPAANKTSPEPVGNSANLPEDVKKALLLTATALSGEASGKVLPDGQSFEMTITNSVTLEQEADLLPLHSSRAAWVFYKNLEESKLPYSKIVVKSVLKDTTVTRDYPSTDLAIVKARLPIFEQTGNLLLARDWKGLYAMFDPAVMGTMQVKGLEEFCTQLEPNYGRPVSFEFRGFSFNRSSSGKEFLSLAGPLKRDTKDTAIDVAIDLSLPGPTACIAGIKFDY